MDEWVKFFMSLGTGTHKFLRVHNVFEETLLSAVISAVCAGQSQRQCVCVYYCRTDGTPGPGDIFWCVLSV
jgi:hypothetical protein